MLDYATLLTHLRFLDRTHPRRLPILRFRQDELAAATFPPGVELRGIDFRQDRDLRYPTDTSDSVHGQFFDHVSPPQVEFHLDRYNACKGAVAHLAADTKFTDGLWIGATVGGIGGTLLGRPVIGIALGTAVGIAVGADTPRAVRTVYSIPATLPPLRTA
jgi:hypothetical protein